MWERWKDQSTPLHMAASLRKYKVMDWLIEKGAPLNVPNDNGDSFIVALLQQANGPGWFSSAATKVLELLQRDLDFDLQGETGKRLLFLAVDGPLTKNIAEQLAKRGVSILPVISSVIKNPHHHSSICALSTFDRRVQGDARSWIPEIVSAESSPFTDEACELLITSATFSSAELEEYALLSLRNQCLPLLKALLKCHGDHFSFWNCKDRLTGENIFHCLANNAGRFLSYARLTAMYEYVLSLTADKDRLQQLLREENHSGVCAISALLKADLQIWTYIDKECTLNFSHNYGFDSPLGFELAKICWSPDLMATILERLGEKALDLKDQTGRNIFLAVVSSSTCSPSYAVEEYWQMIASKGVDICATDNERRGALELLGIPSKEKFLERLLKKRKRNHSDRGSSSSGSSNGSLPVAKKVKKEAEEPPGEETRMYITGHGSAKEWTGNGFSEFGDKGKIIYATDIGAYKVLLNLLSEIEVRMGDVKLIAGEANNPPWSAFIITDAQISSEGSVRRALGSPFLHLTKKAIHSRKIYFTLEDDEDSVNCYQKEEIDVLTYCSVLLKKNFKKLFQIVPGGSLDSGALPIFIGGYWDDNTIGGLFTHFVWT